MDQDRLDEVRASVENLLSVFAKPEDRVQSTSGSAVLARISDRIHAVFDAWSQWRYENPGQALLASLTASVTGLAFCFALLWAVADSSFGKDTGLFTAREKVSNVYYALVWSTRAFLDSQSEKPLQPQRFSGSIEKVVGNMMIVAYYDQGKQLKRVIRLANVIVQDVDGFKTWSEQYRLKGMLIDFYIPLEKVSGYDVWAAVLWYRQAPINVELVELGLGHPAVNPPTVVVNDIFSRHYWSLVKGG